MLEPDAPVGAGVVALWSKRAHRGPMDALEEATLVVGEGMRGSVGESRRRQVTLVSLESWRAATEELGTEVDPIARRANILLTGVDLENTRERVLRIGGARLMIGGETRPCERMDAAAPGLRAALEAQWRGGTFAQVITAGVIRVGDAVEWEV